MKYKLFTAKHGNFSGVQIATGLNRPRGQRDKIRYFSRGSRRRVLTKIQSIDKTRIYGSPVFCTLTYPGTYSSDPTIWKSHLDRIGKRLKRKFPTHVIFWRLEFQKRGAPHFHFIFFSTNKNHRITNIYNFRRWLARAWFDIAGNGDEKHLKAGTQADFIKSWNGVIHYTAKYITKQDTTEIQELYPDFVGRLWGIINREHLPVTILETALTPAEFYALRRVIKNYLQKKTRHKVILWGSAGGISAFIDYNYAIKFLALAGDIIEHNNKYIPDLTVPAKEDHWML